MKINNSKECVIEVLKIYNDILQDDFIRVVKTLYYGANDSLERLIILNTAVSFAKAVRDRTDDLINHIERDI